VDRLGSAALGGRIRPVTGQKMLVAYVVLAIIAFAMLIWALNQRIPQVLGGPGLG
jgi:hypothetical protein